MGCSGLRADRSPVRFSSPRTTSRKWTDSRDEESRALVSRCAPGRAGGGLSRLPARPRTRLSGSPDRSSARAAADYLGLALLLPASPPGGDLRLRERLAARLDRVRDP